MFIYLLMNWFIWIILLFCFKSLHIHVTFSPWYKLIGCIIAFTKKHNSFEWVKALEFISERISNELKLIYYCKNKCEYIFFLFLHYKIRITSLTGLIHCVREEPRQDPIQTSGKQLPLFNCKGASLQTKSSNSRPWPWKWIMATSLNKKSR